MYMHNIMYPLSGYVWMYLCRSRTGMDDLTNRGMNHIK